MASISDAVLGRSIKFYSSAKQSDLVINHRSLAPHTQISQQQKRLLKLKDIMRQHKRILAVARSVQGFENLFFQGYYRDHFSEAR